MTSTIERPTVTPRLSTLLRCPDCSGSVTQQADALRCDGCARTFEVIDGVPRMMPAMPDDVKADMLDFWGHGYEYRFSEYERTLTPEMLREQLEVGAAESVLERQLIGVEIDLATVRGKRVLEIGCGGGGQGLILGTHGAELVSSDLCLERTLPAARKIRMLGIDGEACQADAESLPFKDNLFDIVFSQGVLHHTPRTEVTIQHVHRVLKPGGVAYIGLYARHSFHYYVTTFLYMGILRGNIFRFGRQWLSALSEVVYVRPGGGRNPLTKVYSARELREMFKDFSDVSIRKSDFNFSQIPLFERAEKLLKPERYLPRAPRRKPSAIERALGPSIGWSFYIAARK